MDLATAIATIEALGIPGLIIEPVPESSETVPEGDVIRVVPAVGDIAIPGSTVTITYSQGNLFTVVPDIVGQHISAASAAIAAAQLVKGEATYQVVTEPNYYKVISQNPLADEEAGIGSAVNYLIGVPALVDLTGSRLRGRRH